MRMASEQYLGGSVLSEDGEIDANTVNFRGNRYFQCEHVYIKNKIVELNQELYKANTQVKDGNNINFKYELEGEWEPTV